MLQTDSKILLLGLYVNNIVLFGRNDSHITKDIFLSNMESEFIFMTDATKELAWFDRIFKESANRNLMFDPKIKLILFIDNL